MMHSIIVKIYSLTKKKKQYNSVINEQCNETLKSQCKSVKLIK